MKTSSAIVGGLLTSLLGSSLSGLIVGAFVDTTTEAGKATLGQWQLLTFFGLWVVLAALFRRAATARLAWARTFLWLGIFSLAAPLATIVFSAGLTSRQTTAAAGVGAGIGGGIATIGIGILAFFVAAIFLVIAFALSRGSPRPEPMKKCPQCAEVVLAAARVCRFCGHTLGLSTPATS